MKKLLGFLLRKAHKKATKKRLHQQVQEMDKFVKEM